MTQKIKLTKTVVLNAVSRERDYIVWDSELVGFGLRVWPSGKKTFMFKYRAQNGRQRKVTIGSFPTTSVDQARKRAKELSADVVGGSDPQAEKKVAQNSLNMQELVDRYLRDYATLHKKPSSVKRDENLLRVHVLPVLGKMRVNEVTNDDVYRLHQRVTQGGHIIRHSLRKEYNGKTAKPQPITANRVIAVLSKIMNLAELWGMRPQNTNPCKFIKRNKENKRERYLTPKELAALNEAMTLLMQEGNLDRNIVDAIKVLMFTGCRVSEVLDLKWDEVNFEASRLELRDSKTGAKNVPLGAPALAVIAEQPKFSENPYVFVGRVKGKGLAFIRKAWYRICDRAGIKDIRLHDLRHTFASFGVSGNMSLPVIGKLLGHTQMVTTQRYAHLMDDPLRAAADQVSSSIQAAFENMNAENVVELHSGKGVI